MHSGGVPGSIAKSKMELFLEFFFRSSILGVEVVFDKPRCDQLLNFWISLLLTFLLCDFYVIFYGVFVDVD